MSLDLDPRQRAMLQEMGVTVWWPHPTMTMVSPVSEEAQVENNLAYISGNVAINNVSVHALYTATKTELPLNSVRNPLLNPGGISTRPPSPALTPSQATGNPPIAITAVEGVASMAWPELQQAVTQCRACGLCAGRKNAVVGTVGVNGHYAPSTSPPSQRQTANWLIVGDGPSEGDDAAGDIFTGEAGALLDNMLKALGLRRSEVALTHAIKCRPAGGRNPDAQELAQCSPYLQRQIELVQPTVILAMGRLAAVALLQAALPDVGAQPLGKLRGQVHRVMMGGQARVVVVTYPPATLLRSPSDKAKAWADLCLALAAVDTVPSAGPNAATDVPP